MASSKTHYLATVISVVVAGRILFFLVAVKNKRPPKNPTSKTAALFGIALDKGSFRLMLALSSAQSRLGGCITQRGAKFFNKPPRRPWKSIILCNLKLSPGRLELMRTP